MVGFDVNHQHSDLITSYMFLKQSFLPFPIRDVATSISKMLCKYRPEDRAQKVEHLRQRAQAEAEAEGKSKKPIAVKYGLNHVTYLIEQV